MAVRLIQRRALLALLLVVFACGGLPSPAVAQPGDTGVGPTAGDDPTDPEDESAPEDEPRWRLTPYIWIPEIAGSTSSDGEDGEGSISFFEALKAFGFVGVDAGRDRWRFRGDLKFLRLDGEWDRPRDTGFELDIAALELTGLRRVHEQTRKDPWIPSLDLFAGVRLWSARVQLEFIGQEVEGTEEWIDPLIGAQASWKRGHWRGHAAGDIGGFGVGSELCWQVFAGVGYRFTKNFTFGLDYRLLDIDAPFDSGPDFWALDLQLRGPQLTFTFEF